MNNNDKVFYTTSILDDDGILHIYSGWYNKYAPYVGQRTCISIDTKVEDSESKLEGELINA